MDRQVLRLLIDNLSYFVFWKDLQSNYLGCNKAFARVAGLENPEDIAGKSDYDLAWTKEEAECYCEYDRKVMDNDQPEINLEETQQTADGLKTIISTSKLPIHDKNGNVTGILGFYTDISESVTKREQINLQQSILNTIPNGVIVTTPDGTIHWANPAICNTTGYAYNELIDSNVNIFKSGVHDQRFYQDIWSKVMSGEIWHGEVINRKKDGSLYTEEMIITPLKGEGEEIDFFISVKMDITEKKQLHDMLTQAQRLESIGQLAAGIAHEINTPTQYVGDNTSFLKESFGDLKNIIENYQEIISKIREKKEDDALHEIIKKLNQKEDDLDLDSLLYEIPHALVQMQEGIERIQSIVKSMKEFSHPGSDSAEPVNLSDVIKSTVSIARNEWKYYSEMEIDIDNDDQLKTVPCFAGEIKQALLNIIVNAAQAIESKIERMDDEQKGLIRITAKQEHGYAVIKISDTGIGIAADQISKIFDPFFTTKKVGKGTGQGLNIAYNSIMKKHNGFIKCESEEGKGATFTIKLPLKIGMH